MDSYFGKLALARSTHLGLELIAPQNGDANICSKLQKKYSGTNGLYEKNYPFGLSSHGLNFCVVPYLQMFAPGAAL